MNLDLSKFSSIIPEEDKTSDTLLLEIKEVMENLVNLMQSHLLSIKNKNILLGKRESALKDAEFELDEKEKKLYTDKEAIEKEKHYIITANTLLKEKEKGIQGNKDYLKDIEIAKGEWEDRKAEAIKQEGLLEEKKKGLAGLLQKEKDLEEKEMLIEKSASIDAERKRLLDIREERIKAQEQRLRINQLE